MLCAGKVQYRRSRLTSNVRPRHTHRAVLEQNQRLSAWTEQPRRGGAAKTRSPAAAGRARRMTLADSAQFTLIGAGAASNCKAPLRHIAASNRVRTPGFSQFVGPTQPALVRPASPYRGGSNTWHATVGSAEREAPGAVPQGITGVLAGQSPALVGAARPNPSVEARPNGRPPGPGRWYGTFSPARAWRPAVGPASPPTLGGSRHATRVREQRAQPRSLWLDAEEPRDRDEAPSSCSSERRTPHVRRSLLSLGAQKDLCRERERQPTPPRN